MWSTIWSRLLGDMSMRQITLIALAALMVLFAGITADPARAQEADSQQITGTEESITYANKTYTKLDPIPKNDPTFETSACGAPVITSAYIRFNRPESNQPATGAEVICSRDFTTGEAIIVVFPNAQVAAGSDEVSSFGTITPSERDDIVAIQRRYDLKGLPSGGVSDDRVVDASVDLPEVARDRAAYQALYEKFNANIQHENPTTIGDPDSGNSDTVTSCDSTYTYGLGWVICPITNWLAAGMDALYNILIGFLSVPPLTTDREGPVYYMWGLMRNAANILFIAGFLIIIYSQTTSIGLSNYGIKRLLPRLAIAAILVNTSYWVAAIAVDISNILGVSLQNLLIGVRESIPASEGASFDTSRLSWQVIATAVLTGGSASIFVVGTAVGSLMATAGGSLWFLLVGLAGVMLSVLVAILILAARQALITILIIISPLAFVAYLLPATEGYFQRWRSLFTTMLVMFPIFSLIFGGSQLAGLAIIHTADPGNDNFFTVVILGMIVQVAPVIITPMLIKLSGSLLGRVAGFVNNPNRGIVDQTRKFAQGRQDMTKNRQLWDRSKSNPKQYANNNLLARMGRWNALREADRTHKLKTWEGGLEAAYERDSRSREVHRQSSLNEMHKSIGQKEAEEHFENEKKRNAEYLALDVRKRMQTDAAERATSHISNMYEDLKAGTDAHKVTGITNPEDAVALSSIIKHAERAQQLSQQIQSESYHLDAAKRVRELNYADAIKKNPDLAEYAGGVDPYGTSRAIAKATTAENQAIAEAINNEKATMSKTDTTELTRIMKDRAASEERRAAAAATLVKRGSTDDVMDTITWVTTTKDDPAISTIQQQISEDIGGRKPAAVGEGAMAQMTRGELHLTLGMDDLMRDRILAGKMTGAAMANMPREELEHMLKVIQNTPAVRRSVEFQNLRDDIRKYRTDPNLVGNQPALEKALVMDDISRL